MSLEDHAAERKSVSFAEERYVIREEMSGVRLENALPFSRIGVYTWPLPKCQ